MSSFLRNHKPESHPFRFFLISQTKMRRNLSLFTKLITCSGKLSLTSNRKTLVSEGPSQKTWEIDAENTRPLFDLQQFADPPTPHSAPEFARSRQSRGRDRLQKVRLSPKSGTRTFILCNRTYTLSAHRYLPKWKWSWCVRYLRKNRFCNQFQGHRNADRTNTLLFTMSPIFRNKQIC